MKILGIARKTASILANLSLFLNTFFPFIIAAQPAYAQSPEEAVPSIVEFTPTPEPSIVVDPTPSAQPTPENSPTPSEDPIVTPTIEPTITPEITPSPEATPSPEVTINPTPEVSADPVSSP